MPADTSCPRLIEVALPIREISAESARDKSLRHGHISTLHLWWARRTLVVRVVVVPAKPAQLPPMWPQLDSDPQAGKLTGDAES